LKKRYGFDILLWGALHGCSIARATLLPGSLAMIYIIIIAALILIYGFWMALFAGAKKNRGYESKPKSKKENPDRW
jgi:predicted histidine transporter YuiF (NhaC family)